MTHEQAPLTPEQVLRRRRQAVVDQDVNAFAELFAPDGVIEIPFAGPDMPARLEGKETIREHTRHVVASALRIDDVEMVTLYQTTDPEIVIAETLTTGTSAGHPFSAASIQVFRIRDGQIALFRDYADPRVGQ